MDIDSDVCWYPNQNIEREMAWQEKKIFWQILLLILCETEAMLAWGGGT